MKINIRNLIIIGILGGIIGWIFPNPLIFVPLAIITGVIGSIFLSILEEDT